MIFQNFIDMQQFIDTYDFSGKKAIVRVDFNVPLNDKMEITDDTRIRAAIPTLKKVLEKGGSLIIMSHLGRPKGVTDKFSLKHILGRVEELLGAPVKFADDCMNADDKVAALKPGEVLVLETSVSMLRKKESREDSLRMLLTRIRKQQRQR